MGQRLRVIFSRGEETKYLSHLELMRMWERVFRRAGWRLAYSHGFNPHPHFSFAAPLPVGVAGEAEMMELLLDEVREPAEAAQQLSGHVPPGVGVVGIQEIPEAAPTMQRQLVAAEYRVACPASASLDRLRVEAARMMEAATLPRQRVREGKTRSYDLRPMLRYLEILNGTENGAVARMELRIDADGAGRPDEVLRELGIDPADCRITRTRLLMKE